MTRIKTKREAIASIKQHKRLMHGVVTDVYDVYVGVLSGGKQVRLASTRGRNDLIARIDEFYRKFAVMGDTVATLTPSQVYDAKNAIAALENAGLDISLVEAVNRLIAGKKVIAATNTTIGAAYNAYYASIRDIQVEHKKAVKQRVLPWVQAIGSEVKLSEVTNEDFQSYIAEVRKMIRVKGGQMIATKDKIGDKTRNNIISYCKTFMQWCVGEKLIAENPIADVKLAQILWEEPEYVPVADVAKMFAALMETGNKAIIAFAALSFFAGVRTSEIQGIANNPDGAFRLEDNSVRILMPKGLTKGIMPRTIELEANARAWLDFADGGKAMSGCSVDTMSKVLRRIAAKHGIKLCHNAGRHSYITYHVAIHHTPEVTAGLAGNSPKMIRDHYAGLATTSQGEAYFKIMPPSVSLG